MQRVYRLLKEAREQNIIPWEWIVDETRELERVASWNDPEDYVDSVSRGYRRDFWPQQPKHVEVWSEKGTVRGLLDPVFDKYGVGFRAVHGFSSATLAHDIANDAPDKPLVILYVGDYDPSGMFMSEVDLPERFLKYGGDHIELKRIALTSDQVRNLPSFPAKRKDPRYRCKVDAFALGRDVLAPYQAEIPGSRILDGHFHRTGIAIAVPKNRPAALAHASAFLKEAKASGLVRRAFDKAGLQSTAVAPAE